VEPYREGLTASLCDREVSLAAALDLDVQPAGVRVVDLRAVHAEVGDAGHRVAGLDERESDEGAAVARPGAERRELSQVGGAVYDLRDRRAPDRLRAGVHDGLQEVPVLPQVAELGGHELMRRARQPRDVLGRELTEGEVDASLAAEEVGGEAERAPADPVEEERGPAGGDHPPVDLRRL